MDDLAGELHGDALDDLMMECGSRSYDCHSYILDSSDYGLPQGKRRLFIIGLLRPSRGFDVQDYSKFFEGATSLLSAFRMSGPSLDEVLFEDNDECIKVDLSRRQLMKAKGWESHSISMHRQAWAQKGLRFQAMKASDNTLASPWFDTLPLRERDVVAFHQHVHRSRVKGCKEEKDKLAMMAPLCAVDVSQGIHRAPHSTIAPDGRLVLCTVLPGSKIFLDIDSSIWPSCTREVRRLLHGQEALNFIGWPVRAPDLAFYPSPSRMRSALTWLAMRLRPL